MWMVWGYFADFALTCVGQPEQVDGSGARVGLSVLAPKPGLKGHFVCINLSGFLG